MLFIIDKQKELSSKIKLSTKVKITLNTIIMNTHIKQFAL